MYIEVEFHNWQLSMPETYLLTGLSLPLLSVSLSLSHFEGDKYKTRNLQVKGSNYNAS
jgi:hypothetical protein